MKLSGAWRTGRDGSHALMPMRTVSRPPSSAALLSWMQEDFGMARRTKQLHTVIRLARRIFDGTSPVTDEQISILLKAMERIPLSQLGVEEFAAAAQAGASANSERPRGAQPPGVVYIPVVETSSFTMGIFCLEQGRMIPLHDHPGMTVASRLLYGKLHVRSFDWLDVSCSAQPATYDTPRPARLTQNCFWKPEKGPNVLYPTSGGNLHQFVAITDCAILDILAPPYDEDSGRECTYYKEVDWRMPAGYEADAPEGTVVKGMVIHQGCPFTARRGKYHGLPPEFD